MEENIENYQFSWRIVVCGKKRKQKNTKPEMDLHSTEHFECLI